jgi:hypothetical protein
VARFARRRSALIAITAVVLLVPAIAWARLDLTGCVLGASGAPVRGATVYLYEAGPRTGLSPFSAPRATRTAASTPRAAPTGASCFAR